MHAFCSLTYTPTQLQVATLQLLTIYTNITKKTVASATKSVLSESLRISYYYILAQRSMKFKSISANFPIPDLYLIYP